MSDAQKPYQQRADLCKNIKVLRTVGLGTRSLLTVESNVCGGRMIPSGAIADIARKCGWFLSALRVDGSEVRPDGIK